MKVYVMTKAKSFHPEEYIGVKSSLKEAEKAFRKTYPHMKKDLIDSYTADSKSNVILFIHEEEI